MLFTIGNMNRVFILFVGCLVCFKAENYTLTAPKIFRSGSSYRFTVTVYGKKNVEYHLEARIEDSAAKVLVQNGFHVKDQDPSHEFELIIPSVIPDQVHYDFEVNTFGDVNFSGSHRVDAVKKTHSLFIQTDKYLYKPGQKVLFRILGINEQMKPYTGPIDITIYDKSDNRIYRQERQKNVSGVISGHLQLSDITPLGRWKIEAESETLTKVAFFEVAEYVLPKFEVKVLLPRYFVVHKDNPSVQKLLTITTMATYTFGKSVKGYALVTISLKYSRLNNDPPKFIYKNVKLLDGKADISVTLEELNQLSNGGISPNYNSLFVQANVTEEVTGIILQGNNTVPIVANKYKLTFLSISADNFKPGFNYKAFVQLSQADDSEPLFADIKYPNGTFKSLAVEVQLTDVITKYEPFYEPWNKPQKKFETFYVSFDANGYSYFEIPTENYWRSLNIKVSYFDEESHTHIVAHKPLKSLKVRDNKYIQLALLENEVIKAESQLKLNVRSSELITVFNYQVLGKGRLLLSDSYYSSNPSNDIDFTILISENLAVNLAPTATIVVSCVTSTGELVADSLVLSVTDYFANKVTISFDPETTLPGKEVLLRVKASADSFVSLLAVDQSVLLLSAGNDITWNVIEEDIYMYEGAGKYKDNFVAFGNIGYKPWRGGPDTHKIFYNAGLFVLSDYHINQVPVRRYRKWCDGKICKSARKMSLANLPVSTENASPDPSPDPSPDELNELNFPRTNFPESWIWSDVIVGSNGFLELKYEVPDTMTSWIATAFATNTKFGLGIASNSAKVTVIKPFFINLNLPSSIIRGEQFAVQVTLFNYYGMELTVDVSLAKSNYFQIIKCTSGTEYIVNEDASKNVKVSNNDMVTVYFWIVATSLGQIPIEVKAVAGVAADALVVNLLVKPEGQPQAYSSSSLIRIPQEQSNTINFGVSLPPKTILVPGSVVIEVTVIGDILGTAFNNLDKLLQMPYGCGEQNMVTLAPDVYIVQYLTATNQLTEEIKSKALEFINQGYQRQLTYQRIDGSFSAFGDNDPAGSVWLSSFVAKVFRQSSEYISIDDSKIARCITWILQHQTSEGVFAEPPNGRVIHTAMQGGSSAGVSLTAYVVISLLLNRNTAGVNNIHEKIQLTISYLEAQYNSFSHDSYILSITGYAFYLSGSPKLSHICQLLDSLAIKEDGMKYWHKVSEDQNQPSSWRPPYEAAQSQDVEMTSYVLLIYASKGEFSNSLPIAKWLINKRNPQGGFVSTQDTVLGYEALAVFGKLILPPINSDGLTVKVNQDATSEVYTFATIDKKSLFILQSHQIPSNARNVTVSATGQGLALVQLNVKYYINSPKENQLIKQTLITNSSNSKLALKICLSWQGSEVTGMVLTEVNLLTGFTLSSYYASVLEKEIGTAYKKQELSGNRFSIYLDGLTEKDLCFTVKMERTFYVKMVKPALVKTYRYYSPDQVMSGYYSPTSTSESWNACDPLFTN